MYVTDSMIHRIVELYGVPVEKLFIINSAREEVERIRASQRDGRDHDVTVYIRKEDKVVVIAKHFYPPGLYRAPSGGIHFGEDFETGVRREMAEETGCDFRLDRFLLKTSVQFAFNPSADASFQSDRQGKTDGVRDGVRDDVRWRSFVFLATYTSGDFNFTDKHEIREVRLADWKEFETFGRIMRQLPRGGFLYRAALHEAVVAAMGGRRRIG
jgi:8-oxo-dGTP pyrophosphatase MutT (NUDIX family)